MSNNERPKHILVRYGWQGHVGKFQLPMHFAKASGPNPDYGRGSRIVIESPRGLEIGQVLGDCNADGDPVGNAVRKVMPEDELLAKHLVRLSVVARDRCIQWLDLNGSPAVLLEVEPLLDGKNLFFHFLSDVDRMLQAQIDELARLYETEVAQSEFAKRVSSGCGPGCGTEAAMGRACKTSGGCSGCSVSCGASSKSASTH